MIAGIELVEWIKIGLIAMVAISPIMAGLLIALFTAKKRSDERMEALRINAS